MPSATRSAGELSGSRSGQAIGGGKKATGGSENAAIGSRPASQRDASYGSKPGEGIGKRAKDAVDRVNAELSKPASTTGASWGKGIGSILGGIFGGGIGAVPGGYAGAALGGLFDSTPEENARAAFNDAMGPHGVAGWGGGGWGGAGGNPGGNADKGAPARPLTAMEIFKNAVGTPDPLTGQAPGAGPGAGAGAQSAAAGSFPPGPAGIGDIDHYGETQGEYQFYPPMSELLALLASNLNARKKQQPAPVPGAIMTPGTRTPMFMGIK